MIFHVRHIPFGVYFYPTQPTDLAQIALGQEEAILLHDRDWLTDMKSPTTARYRHYNFLTFAGTEAFKDFLLLSIDDFYRRMRWPIPSHRWLQCWVNIHREGQFLSRHVHSDCKLSGHMTLACNGTRTTYFSEHSFSLENEPGILTLIGTDFVPHETSPVEGSDVRISVAFDLYEHEEKVRGHWVRLEPEP
jgi:hypothetical protein